MKVFKNGNWSDGKKCPLCKTSKQGEIVLIPIAGTRDGDTMRAIEVHVKCLGEKLRYFPEFEVIISSG